MRGLRRPQKRQSGIDRTPQNIPIQLGSFDVVRKSRRIPPLRKFIHRNAPTGAAILGLVVAVIGGLLSYNPPAVPVGRAGAGGGIQLGDVTLTPNPTVPNSYGGGNRPAMMVIPLPDGTTRGVAVGFVHGRKTTGSCILRQSDNAVSEACIFMLGDISYSSTDTIDVKGGAVWHRRYADGQGVSIAIPPNGSVVPVPFPIGK